MNEYVSSVLVQILRRYRYLETREFHDSLACDRIDRIQFSLVAIDEKRKKFGDGPVKLL